MDAVPPRRFLPDALFRRILDRLIPKAPDFYALLHEQAIHVQHTTHLLVRFMKCGDEALATEIRRDEHTADTLKIRNLHTLNEAFSTPCDREDIYRAIMTLDDVVNYCKTTVSEMHVLGVAPDVFMHDMAVQIDAGAKALIEGYGKLALAPATAEIDADAGRKAERRVEKRYRKALAALFVGDDYLNMFKRREIYRHLSNAADRMAACANTLHDIVVKIT
ncbi:DUF47 domain-containing protein [Denitromonas iodatirespirans]|uniref:DUF47 family protein n=1 Tax=Denitromonas iodatirespirans TaxID=2795389 RepID=A0A944HB67_DENI1|nr:DUF47 family protein [Denitromonas iodatirespirans]MBT0960011.1 DUF47 family protein [Denitromonas iodatirespirans]